MYYKLVGGDYYFDIDEASFEITISKAKVDLPTANSGLVYNGSEQTGVTLAQNPKYTLTNNKKTDAGEYQATAELNDKSNYVWNILVPTSDNQTINWSIQKSNQSAPSAPTVSSKTATSVTLNTDSNGIGSTLYGYNTSTTAPTSWQTGTTFSNLIPGNDYYFFAKYNATGNYTESNASLPSSKVTIGIYSITYNLNDGEFDTEYSAPTKYTYGVGATLPTEDNLSRSSYAFKGWYESNTFSGNAVTTIGTNVSGDKVYYAKWEEKWVKLCASINGEDAKYFPVLGGTNPEPVKFGYKYNNQYIEINGTGTGGTYKMSDLRDRAKSWNLYFKGGSVVGIRSVKNVTWNDVFKTGSSYPYHASMTDLQSNFLSTKIDINNESIVQIVGDDETPSTSNKNPTVPTFNGVSINDIISSYYFENGSELCNATYPFIWSNYLSAADRAFAWQYESSTWGSLFQNNSVKTNLLVVRVFN